LEPYELYVSLGLAIAAGLLIGIERELSAPRDSADGSFLGGARTHPLVALVAGLSVLVSRETGWPVVVAAFASLILFLVVNFFDDVRRGAERGLTSEAAFLVSFLLGALSLTRDVIRPREYKFLAVAGVAVVATALLSAKPALNPLVRRLSRQDVVATLKFLILSVVVLPLLPDRAFGPFDALNPRQIGTLVVLMAGISFLGYAAIRFLGPQRGLGLTGLVGGLASSTAVTLSMSARARDEPRLADSLALSVVLSSSIMFVRMGISSRWPVPSSCALPGCLSRSCPRRVSWSASGSIGDRRTPRKAISSFPTPSSSGRRSSSPCSSRSCCSGRRPPRPGSVPGVRTPLQPWRAWRTWTRSRSPLRGSRMGRFRRALRC